MSLSSVLYISRSTIAPCDAGDVVDQIVATATARNPGAGLTGALLFTGTYFAQVLEGRDDAVDALLARLRHDPRHDQLQIVNRNVVDQRQFAQWNMAYHGPSQFVARHVTRLVNDPSTSEHRRAAQWLTELMHEFASSPGSS